MDLVTIVAAAEEHASQTPFLVAGGLLAVFAVLVGAFGLVRHELSDGLANRLMGIGALLVAGTMVSVIVS